MQLRHIPVGSIVHNVEMRRQGCQLARSAGSSVSFTAREGIYAYLRLKSVRRAKCISTAARRSAKLEMTSTTPHYGKAGAKRWLGIRPTVRGLAMNPVDHPHGGVRQVWPG